MTRPTRKRPKPQRAQRPPTPRKKMGRPSIFTQALADEICRRLAEGESLRSICSDPAMPSRPAVLDWLEQHKEFSVQYARARERGYEHWADEILDIADDGTNDFIERQTRNGVQKENGLRCNSSWTRDRSGDRYQGKNGKDG